jgi:hypothetical protein
MHFIPMTSERIEIILKQPELNKDFHNVKIFLSSLLQKYNRVCIHIFLMHAIEFVCTSHSIYGTCLFDCIEPHEQFYSYLAVVTITGDRAANLDLCLALTRLLAARVLLRVTPTATQDLHF